MTKSNLSTNSFKNNYPPHFEMKLVLQRDLIRNVTKDKIEEVKSLVEGYQHSNVLRSDIPSDLQSSLFSMSNLFSVQVDVWKNIEMGIAELMIKGKKEEGNSDEK